MNKNITIQLKKRIQLTSCISAMVLLAGITATASETLSLAGDWRFEIASTNAAGFAKELPGKIKLPGTIDDARLGPPNTQAPTLEGPWRLSNYAGPAWYQRDIEIPESWTGKRVTLFLERCRWVTTVWLDDQRIGTQDSLVTPHVYVLGMGLKPGKHTLTICVDNTDKVNLGKFVSALRGGTWGNMNGIIGRIELGATPPVWIDDVKVFPDVDKKLARVVVKIGNATGKAGEERIKASVFRLPYAKSPAVALGETLVKWDEKGGHAEFEIQLGPDVKLWDEFSPNLYDLEVRLGVGPEPRTLNPDPYVVQFGMRKFTRQGTQFTLNGRPIFLRGTLECSVFPLTGYPPMDVESWRKIYQIEKSYGLNHIRFHSWCPPEAAFTAADIEGIMIQAEGPMANVDAGKEAARDAFMAAEYQRIVDTYGNHPSFCLMALGNEFKGKTEVLTGWLDMLISRDPRRLYASPCAWQTTTNRQFTVTQEGRGIKDAATSRDLSSVVAKDSRPTVGHEIGQWMYWPDSREITKWTGVMALKNFEMVRDDLKKKNLFDLEPLFIESCGKFATLLYKEEIEVLMRTPGFGGFALLDLHDYPTQGTALIGPLNAFWESKGFITPEGYRRFCNSTVALARMPKRTYTTAETFEATVQVAHFGPVALKQAAVRWELRSEGGEVVSHGELLGQDIPTGKLSSLGVVKADLSKLQTPARYTLCVKLGESSPLSPDCFRGNAVANDWEIWVYPATPVTAPAADILVCKTWTDAKAGLDAGKKVVLFPGVKPFKNSMAGKFLPVFWSPVWFPSQKPNTMGLLCDPKHPLFAQFPTELHTNWQWYDLMEQSQIFILDDTPAGDRPLVRVIDNFSRNHKLGIVFEARVGKGELLVCGFDLLNQEKSPAAQQFLRSLYAYAGSTQFKPVSEMKPEALDTLFEPAPAKETKAKK
jgi:Glycosyl hydrolases family 2, sugar binding domain/Glycosyl hydrolases family 2